VVIMGIGWGLALWAANGLVVVLLREDVKSATAIALYARIAIIIFFSAIALVQLDVAGTIVTIGFTTIFITLGVIAIVLAVMESKASCAKKKDPASGKDDNGGE
jgi:hypothetical protein